MAETENERVIEIRLERSEETLWVLRDTVIPKVGDTIRLENADASAEFYEVRSRLWSTAKQGESSFSKITLLVQSAENQAWVLTRNG